MVMTSSEISALVGQQNQMMAGQMQHAAMISQQAGMQTAGENLMGRAMNVGMGVGSPLIQGAMSIAGLDPVSMALRGGMMGMGGGALGMAGGAALGAGIGVPIMAAQYGVQQMLQGAQQQQQLNSMLRQNYGFMGMHGRGFTTGEMGGIGQMIRQQAMTRGPAGEFASFEELGQLAGRMGQMGLGGQAVRNAFEFNDKFKQMLGQVKEIATAFNTSLEQAQQIMSSMRGAGIFRNQGQVAQQIREISMAGGLATSEVTGMMTVGSQISRMIGGRGQAGATGGMRTIAQIGMAQQMGTLDDEQLYNLTGLTGAEGRRALATQRMQQAAGFLRGGLGRRMIASMAGANGTLDEGSAEEWEGGGVGTGRTMGMAGRNLGRVGRANFIRNEGRLRGEVLGRFGGLAPIAAMSSWLEQRGMDPNSDRGLIFMSRHLGMSTEEVEQQLKEYNQLDSLKRLERDQTGNIQAQASIDQYRKNRGISGVKRKFEDARNTVQNTLRQAGADFFQSGSEMVERWVNKITGDFVMSVDRDVGAAIRAYSQGDVAASEQRFGLGKGVVGQRMVDEIQQRTRAAHGVLGRSTLGEQDIRGFRRAGWEISGSEGLGRIHQLRSAALEGTKGNFFSNVSDSVKESLRTQAAFGRLATGGDDFLKNFEQVLAQSGDKRLQMIYARGTAEEKARMAGDIMRGAGLGAMYEGKMSTPDRTSASYGKGWRTQREMLEAYASYRYGEQDPFFDQRVQERGDTIGRFAEAATRGVAGTTVFSLSGGYRQAVGELAEGIGAKAASIHEGFARSGRSEGVAKTVRAIGEGYMGLLTGVPGRLFGLHQRGGEALVGKYEEATGATSREALVASSEYLRTEEGRKAMENALSRDPAQRAFAMQDAREKAFALEGRVSGREGKATTLERGKWEAQRTIAAMSILSKYHEQAEKAGVPLTEEQKRQAETELRNLGITSFDQAMGMYKQGAGILSEAQRDARRELLRRVGGESKEAYERYQRAGLIKDGVLTSAALGKVGAEVTVGTGEEGRLIAQTAGIELGGRSGAFKIKTGQLYTAAMKTAERLEMEAAAKGDTPESRAMLTQAMNIREMGTEQGLSGMSTKEMRARAAEMRGAGDAAGAKYLESLGIKGQRLEQGAARGGVTGLARVVEKQLGVNLGKRDIQSLVGKGPEEAARLLMSVGGVTGEDTEKDLAQALKLAQTGKGGAAAAKLEGIGTKFVEAQRERQYEAAKKDDPTVRAITDMKNSVTEAIKGDLNVNVKNIADINKAGSAEGGGGGAVAPGGAPGG